ncbi:MAG: LysR family transcriptional regulator [Pseudomonadota bacterium]
MEHGDLKRLMIFAQVINSGSFAAAARKLGLPRSSVSKQVSELEESLGIRLIQRTTRKLSLTQEGGRILQHCESIAHDLGQIELVAESESISGHVTISVAHDVAEAWLLPRLHTFRLRHPDIYVRIVVDDFVSDIVGEQIDLALRGAIADDASSLIGREIGREATRFYASPDYVDQHGQPDKLSDLQQHTWVLLTQVFPQQNVNLYSGKRVHKFKATRFHETDSPNIERLMIEQGMGIGIHLPSMAASSVSQGKMVQVLPNHHSVTVRFSLVYPSRVLPLRTRLLVEHLVQSGWFNGR